MQRNWDDLRFFLAVARAGTLSGAARALEVNHSTVFRRVGAFEEEIGTRLFERLPSGYLLTPAGEQMRDVALRLEGEIASLDRLLVGQDRRMTGTVRITTVDMLGLGVLPRHLAAFRSRYSGVELELTVSNSVLNLTTRREADIALRISNDPPEALVGRRVGRLVFAAYGAPGYLATRRATELAGHDWIGLDSEHAPLARRFARLVPEVRPVLRTNSVAATIAAARTGMGLAILPCGLADMEHDLVRFAALPDEFTLDLWLLTHEDLRTTARIRAVLDFLAERLAAEADLFAGLRPEAWREGLAKDAPAAG